MKLKDALSSLKTLIKNAVTFIYLTFNQFFSNGIDLLSCACAFNFLFSFIPILFILLTVLQHIFHLNRATLSVISSLLSQYFDPQQVNALVERVASISLVFRKGNFALVIINLALALFILLMSRKLSLSIVKSLNQIFKTLSSPRPVFNQVFTILGIALFIIICSVVFIATLITRQFFSPALLKSLENTFSLLDSPLLNALFSSISKVITQGSLYLIIFLWTTCMYRFATTKGVKTSRALLHSFLFILTFYLVSTALTILINKSNYNILYGVLSRFMIILLDIYVFFFLFLLYAQALFVSLSLKPLVIAKLYLYSFLPSRAMNKIKKRLISNSLLVKLLGKESLIPLAKESTLPLSSASSPCVYYLLSGKVFYSSASFSATYSAKSFFNENVTLLPSASPPVIKAIEPCVLLPIPKSLFSAAIKTQGRTLSLFLHKMQERIN